MIHTAKASLILIITSLLLLGCKKDDDDELKELSQLEFYIEQNKDLKQDILIGCATGSRQIILNDTTPTLSVFFYVVDSAKDFRIFQTKSDTVDGNDFFNYSSTYPASEDLFNGRMKRFKFPNDSIERWTVLTYLSPGKIHISDPIRIKTVSKPTYHIDSLVTINPNGVNPKFNWQQEIEPNNIIYYQVVGDTAGNMISGTYTEDKFWTFYDLSNVVLNVSPENTPKVLAPKTSYSFTLMGVSEDNWVHTVSGKMFMTE